MLVEILHASILMVGVRIEVPWGQQGRVLHCDGKGLIGVVAYHSRSVNVRVCLFVHIRRSSALERSIDIIHR